MTTRRRAALAALTACALMLAGPSAAQDGNGNGNGDGDGGKPDLEPLRVTGELAAGTYAGYAGYFAGRWIGLRTAAMLGNSNSPGAVRAASGFGYLTGLAASAGAVYAVGSIGDQAGDYGSTLLGATAGLATAAFLNYVVLRPRRDETCCRLARRAARLIEVFLPAIGGTIAFNASRRGEGGG